MGLLKEQVSKFKKFFDNAFSTTSGKVIIILSSALLSFLLLLVIIIFFFANPVLNGFVKHKLISSVESNPGTKMGIGYIAFHPFKNGISIENLEFIKTDPKDSTIELHIKNSYAEINNVNWLMILLGKGLKLGNIELQNLFLQINKADQNKNPLIDSTDKRDRRKKIGIKESLIAILPDKLLPLRINKFTLNSGNLLIREKMSAKNLMIDSIKNISFTITGINVASGEENTLSIAENFKMSIESISHKFKDSKYELSLDSLFISTEDSLISARLFGFKPYVSDNLFFAYKEFQTNRFLTKINKLKITGIDYSGITRESSLFINKIFIDSFLVDIITNKRLPDDPNSPNPKMPNELIRSIENKIKINSLHLSRGLIKYTELFSYSNEPAVLPFNNVNAVIKNITNIKADSGNTSAQINISSNLAGAAKLNVMMNIDLVSDVLSLRYKGKLDSMDMTRLNNFLKLDAGIIVKSCKVKYVNFDVKVHNGHASGSVQPVYENLEIKKLDKEEGKTNLLSKIITFFARHAKIHESNPQDGELKIGKVNRKHSKDEAFFHFIWVSVRDALGEAVGF